MEDSSYRKPLQKFTSLPSATRNI